VAAQAETRNSHPANGPAVYQRRQPETTLLYQTAQAHGLQFLSDPEAEGAELPAFVREEFAAYLRCGILAHGFVRVRCKITLREGGPREKE
jgi:hypothetical protein